MSKYRVVGLEEIKMGVVNTTTFAMPATFTVIPNIVPGTANLAIAVPTTKEYYVEDSDDPDIVTIEAGAKSIEFATRDLATTFMILALGGTSSGASVWKASTTSEAVREKALRIKTKKINGHYMTFDIPRMQLGGSAALRFSNKNDTEPGQLAFAGKIMRPVTSSGTSLPPIKGTWS